MRPMTQCATLSLDLPVPVIDRERMACADGRQHDCTSRLNEQTPVFGKARTLGVWTFQRAAPSLLGCDRQPESIHGPCCGPWRL